MRGWEDEEDDEGTRGRPLQRFWTEEVTDAPHAPAVGQSSLRDRRERVSRVTS